ncbi:MAG: transketolase [Desulfobacterales bacterium S5133MH16]|nr:MAG: transketolase [Desulfobacterales bacterium S5133MH16]
MKQGLSEGQAKIDEICINTIRTLSMDAVQKANSGHPGAPMGLAPAAYVLWTRVMKHNSKNPGWLDRDRFVLSGGHASMLLYSLLHLSGYGVTLDDIKNFRQWGSKTPGHPEFGHTPGVETTTGPLGQGFANAVGMAMAERHLAARFNRSGHEIVDHFTYMMCGDGDMMEGVSSEAASLAGHLGLARLICIYDDNKISIEGSTDITFTEDVALRFKAYNWHILKVDNGNDIHAIFKALQEAKAETERPSLIVLRTHIAFGSPNKQDTADAHGAPLGEEEVRLTKKVLGVPEELSFFIPEQALNRFRKCIDSGKEAEARWQETYQSYSKKYPELAKQWVDAMSGFLTEGWDAGIPEFSVADGPIATRAAFGKVLNAVAEKLPTLIGGSADLAPSNKTYMNAFHEFQKDAYDGRNIRFGVREHAMGGIISGMFLHNGLRPYGGTFLVFADYMRPAIRVASLMKLPIIYIFTHDSIAVGEDGPTHQPVEQLASLRAIPGLTVIRPADASETAQAWRHAVKNTRGPVALILSRQKLPVLNPDHMENGLADGAYILADCEGKPDIILIATGSEVHIALEAQKRLALENIAARVVSMPSWELYEQIPQEYKDRVLLPDVTVRIAIEAGSPMGWEHYVGNSGAIIGIKDFGASAPGGTVMKQFGFTPENIVQKAMDLLNR